MPGARGCSAAASSPGQRQRPDTLELSVLGAQLNDERDKQRAIVNDEEDGDDNNAGEQAANQSAVHAQPASAATRRTRWFHFARKSRRRRRLRGEEEQQHLALALSLDEDEQQQQQEREQQARLAQPETMNIGNSTLTIATPRTTTTTTAASSASNHADDSFYSLAAEPPATSAATSTATKPATAGDIDARVDMEQQYKEQLPSAKPRLSMLQRLASWRRSAPESLPSRRRNDSSASSAANAVSVAEQQQPISTSASARNLRRLSQIRRRRSSYYFSGRHSGTGSSSCACTVDLPREFANQSVSSLSLFADNERRIRANDKEFNSQFKYHVSSSLPPHFSPWRVN